MGADQGSGLGYEQIHYDVADRILTITLHRPERLNAFTAQMAHELVDAFGRADADDGVRVVVLTGAGRGAAPPSPTRTGRPTATRAARSRCGSSRR